MIKINNRTKNYTRIILFIHFLINTKNSIFCFISTCHSRIQFFIFITYIETKEIIFGIFRNWILFILEIKDINLTMS